ncbi:C2 domain-containing protein [Lactarius indigo]|nr:C2 domain-containing protein [Lactarius indigo]
MASNSLPTTPIASSSSAVFSRLRIPILRRGTSKDSTSLDPGETPMVVLRVQVISCRDLAAMDSNGKSDPFVTVSILGKRFQTPVCKRDLNPEYEPKVATFDFPIYKSLSHQLGMLEFVVWDEDLIRNDYMGEYSLPIDHWFRGSAIAFDDPNNEPFSVRLVSSRRSQTVCGTMLIKLGFVHPPDSTSQPDFRNTYEVLMSSYADKRPVGVVMLEICGAKGLPKWPNMFHTDFDMDPFVEVSIGDQVARTRVVRHSLNPIWDEQLFFHVRKQDLSHPMRIAVFNQDRFTRNDLIGRAEFNIPIPPNGDGKDLNTKPYSVDLPTVIDFESPLTLNPRRAYTTIPTITFRANYQPFLAQRY